jgi:hypothetical protein
VGNNFNSLTAVEVKLMKGIYLIENRENGYKYVGRSIDIENRWKQHIYSAEREDGFVLHKAIKKYGIEKFNFSILEKTDLLYESECYWYKKLKPEYNVIPPDEQPNIVQKIRVKSLDKNTGAVKTYDSIREAARQNNISKTAIYNVIRRKRNSANNCYWAYEEEEFIIPTDLGNNGKRRKSVTIKKDNISLNFNSISDAARHLGVSHSCISRTAKGTGRQKRVKGYQVKLNL